MTSHDDRAPEAPAPRVTRQAKPAKPAKQTKQAEQTKKAKRTKQTKQTKRAATRTTAAKRTTGAATARDRREREPVASPAADVDRRPEGGFVALLGVYGAAVGTAALLTRRRLGASRITAGDVALITVATHKLSRRLSKDSVTSPLRSPFSSVTGRGGAPGEVDEQVEGTGLRRAVGELMTCPFCLGQWVATGFTVGLVAAPRATRLVATVFTAAAGADFLQLGYAAAVRRAEGDD